MRKFYISLFLSVAALPLSAEYATPGAGTTYTLESLSLVEGSGLTVVDGEYLLSADLTVSAGDKLQIKAGDVLRLADGVTVNVDGDALFNPDGKAKVIPADAEALPRGFVLSGSATLENMDIEGAGIKYMGSGPLTVNRCDFTNVNSVLSGYGVIVLSGTSYGNKITNCTFTDCEPGAVNTPANMGVELLIEGCTLTNCSTLDMLRPFINVTACADKEVVIRGNTLVGAKLERPGGIGVSNMLNTPGANKVVIENNTVTDCSWGVNLVGGMDVRLVGNTIKDNRWDTDDAGGIAVTMYSIASLPLYVYGEGNIIEGNKWGPCSVGASVVNFGKTDDPTADDYNPGNNIFRNNSFVSASGVETACDFCNQTQVTVYAQGNIWNDAETAEDASATIFGSQYNSAYGPIVFDPVRTPSGVNDVEDSSAAVFEGFINVFTVSGQKVYEGDAASFAVDALPAGIYLVRGERGARKFIK